MTSEEVYARRRPRKSPSPKESQLQFDSAHLFKVALRKDWRAWHTPNGEHRNAIIGAKLKRMGVLPGVPDWVLIPPWGKAHFLELKRAGAELSLPQEEFRLWCLKNGIPHAIAFTFEDVINAAKWWGAIDPAIKI